MNKKLILSFILVILFVVGVYYIYEKEPKLENRQESVFGPVDILQAEVEILSVDTDNIATIRLYNINKYQRYYKEEVVSKVKSGDVLKVKVQDIVSSEPTNPEGELVSLEEETTVPSPKRSLDIGGKYFADMALCISKYAGVDVCVYDGWSGYFYLN